MQRSLARQKIKECQVTSYLVNKQFGKSIRLCLTSKHDFIRDFQNDNETRQATLIQVFKKLNESLIRNGSGVEMSNIHHFYCISHFP